MSKIQNETLSLIHEQRQLNGALWLANLSFPLVCAMVCWLSQHFHQIHFFCKNLFQLQNILSEIQTNPRLKKNWKIHVGKKTPEHAFSFIKKNRGNISISPSLDRNLLVLIKKHVYCQIAFYSRRESEMGRLTHVNSVCGCVCVWVVCVCLWVCVCGCVCVCVHFL